jgi:hypothetical protein
MAPTGDGTVISSAPEPQRPAQSLARVQVRVVSEAGSHERPRSRWCKGRHTPLSSAGPTPMPAVGGPGSRRAMRVRIPGSSSPLGGPPDSLGLVAPRSALKRLRRLLTARSRLSAQGRPDPRLTPPLTPTTLDPDHQLRLPVRREPWTPIDSRRSCDHSRRLPRGAPRAASCPARRLSVSSVSAPGQRRRAQAAQSLSRSGHRDAMRRRQALLQRLLRRCLTLAAALRHCGTCATVCRSGEECAGGSCCFQTETDAGCACTPRGGTCGPPPAGWPVGPPQPCCQGAPGSGTQETCTGGLCPCS